MLTMKYPKGVLQIVLIVIVVLLAFHYFSHYEYFRPKWLINNEIKEKVNTSTDGPPNHPTTAAKTEEETFVEKMKQRQDERKALIQKTCDKFDMQQNVSHAKTWMMIDEKYKIVHCNIGKTGSTRWKELFWQLKGFDKKEFTVQKYPKVKMLAKEREKYLLNPDWMQSMTVREPFERMISAYREKLEPPGPEFPDLSRSIRSKYGRVKDGKLATFSDFINYLVLEAPGAIQSHNDHWNRFTYSCTPCTVKYDFIGHQETIDEDARYFLKFIGAPAHIQHGAANRHHTDEEISLKYYATVKPLERVIQLYVLLLQDYIMFGYPPPVALKLLFGKDKTTWQ